MFSESFDTSFSRVASIYTFRVTSFTPPKYLNPPGHEDINIFQKKFAMGFCADLYPVNRIISKKHLKAGNPILS